jgi:hypothetical protein
MDPTDMEDSNSVEYMMKLSNELQIVDVCY